MQRDRPEPAGHPANRAAGGLTDRRGSQNILRVPTDYPCKNFVCVYAALNRYLPKARNKTGVNLLATTQAEQEEARVQGEVDKAKPREYISYLKPALSIALLDDATSYPANAVPDHVSTRASARALILHSNIQKALRSSFVAW